VIQHSIYLYPKLKGLQNMASKNIATNSKKKPLTTTKTDTKEKAAPTHQESSQEKTPGDLFRIRRTEKKITLEQIASYFKISPKYLIHIEENKYENNRMDVYTRGYLRMYATHLELDYPAIIEQLKQMGIESDYIAPPKTLTEQAEQQALFTVSTQTLFRYSKYFVFAILIVSACMFVTNKLNTKTAKFSDTFELNHVNSLISIKKTHKKKWLKKTNPKRAETLKTPGETMAPQNKNKPTAIDA
jgi:cytoskeletal protein RodZ